MICVTLFEGWNFDSAFDWLGYAGLILAIRKEEHVRCMIAPLTSE
jgi:hypothetical protein